MQSIGRARSHARFGHAHCAFRRNYDWVFLFICDLICRHCLWQIGHQFVKRANKINKSKNISGKIHFRENLQNRRLKNPKLTKLEILKASEQEHDLIYNFAIGSVPIQAVDCEISQFTNGHARNPPRAQVALRKARAASLLPLCFPNFR